MKSRLLTPYEKNQLQKYHLSLDLPPTNITPVEYLTGHVDFSGHDFLVNPSVLIPRVETAEIIPLAVKNLNSKNSLTILDLATGSGALGISLSLQLIKQGIPHQLFLSDISPQALLVAQKNSKRLLPPEHQPTIIESYLFNQIPPHKFDLIVSNLPYIPTNRLKTLDPSVKNYEPTLALDGGPLGTTLINQFLSQMPPFLNPKSFVVLEIDHTHTLNDFVLPDFMSAKILPDQFGYNRFLLLQST